MNGPKRPTVERVPVAEACWLLQLQAAIGGAYLRGLGQAYGRRAKWQCIAALADVGRILMRPDPEDVPGDAVVTIMEGVRGSNFLSSTAQEAASDSPQYVRDIKRVARSYPQKSSRGRLLHCTRSWDR